MFTPTEAGGVGSFGAFLLAFLSRRMGTGGASQALKDTLKGTSMLFAAIIGAYMITTFTALTGIAGDLTSWATGLENVPPLVILASLSLLYIFLGTFMGGVEIMLLTLPVVVPIIKGLDYDLIWFGV